jgi:hypothetical protein
MTTLEHRTLYVTCDRDGCGNRRAVAHGCTAEELAHGKQERLAGLLGGAGWGVDPDGFCECPECAGSLVPLDETLAQRSRRGFYK